jgi:purine-binding chemotaxis protein CheW
MRATDGVDLRWFERSVCIFWLGNQCYGLESSLVGEVFVVEGCVPVPTAPPPVLGLFNLRGQAVALVDLARVLELPIAPVGPGGWGGIDERDRSLLALVVRTAALTVGLHIRKMEVVVPAGRGLYTPPDAGAREHPVVAGFLELPERPELTITLLDPDELMGGLARLRYRSVEEDEGE